MGVVEPRWGVSRTVVRYNPAAVMHPDTSMHRGLGERSTRGLGRVASCLFAIGLLSPACGGAGPVSARAKAEADVIWSDRCANCHGPRGMGDGPGARALPVKPRVLADSSWQSRVTDEHIATVITEGGRVVGLDSNMAANPDLKAKPEVLRALVQKIRGLQP